MVQMNILEATADDEAKDQVYNVVVGGRITLEPYMQVLAKH